MPNRSNNCINMRVTANTSQGHRKYMEDCYKIRFQRENQNDNESDILFSYFAIFDGHGGKEAAHFAKEHLYWRIIESDDFWSEDDNKVLKAIHDGFIKCHIEMWKDLDNWPKTPAGLPSTSGCTATVLFIKKNKAFVGHVGDSGVSIGFGESHHNIWTGRKLTRDHKPEDPIEVRRIEKSGGEIMSKGGVHRVVWNRPCTHPNRNPTSFEKIPFLAVARSLGDLWSYNYDTDDFIVSPVPDVFSFEIDPKVHRCIVMASDGMWNLLKPNEIADIVRQTDKETENLVLTAQTNTNEAQPFVNPSQRLVSAAIQRCCEKMLRADNTTCITIMLDQPGMSFSDNIIQQNQTNQTCNDSQDMGSHSTVNTSTYNTPTFRSKSLISLRRRHWSANAAASSVANEPKRTKSTKTLHRFNENLVYTRSIKKNLFNQTYTYGKKPTFNTDYDDDEDGDDGNRADDLEPNENVLATNSGDQFNFNKNKMPNPVFNQTNMRTPLTIRYKRRLGVLKSRLLTTKNKIIGRNRKIFGKSRNQNTDNTDNGVKYKFEANQSFGETLRTKLTNTLKRQHLSNLKSNESQAKKTRYN